MKLDQTGTRIEAEKAHVRLTYVNGSRSQKFPSASAALEAYQRGWVEWYTPWKAPGQRFSSRHPAAHLGRS